MSIKRTDQEVLNDIRARARQLRQSSDQDQMMADAEVLAAWRDGTLSFEDIPEDVLARLIQRVGRASAARMLTAISNEAPSAESGPSIPWAADKNPSHDIQDLGVAAAPPVSMQEFSKQKSWWSRQGRWLAAAASVAFATTVVYKLIPSQLPPEVPPLPVLPSFHVEWPSTPPFNPQQLTAWATPRVALPTAMPDYKKRAGGTLGAIRKEDQSSKDFSAALSQARGNEALRDAVGAIVGGAAGVIKGDDQPLEDYSAAEKIVTFGMAGEEEHQRSKDYSAILSQEKNEPVIAISTADQFAHWREATVIVRTDEGWGSGSIVSADGWVLTTYQVVQMAAQRAALEGEAARVQVIVGKQGEGSLTPQPALEGTLYRVDPVHDLALLKLAKLPAGRNTLPYFKLAKDIKVDEDCYVIGSQQKGFAWWLRPGNVSKIFNYPKDQKQLSDSSTSLSPSIDRTAATVVATDVRSSPGDSGGPLLNAQGELVGITTVLSGHLTGGSTSWHVALKHVQAFLNQLPDRPEGVPFDVWTMGNPQATLLTPHLLDADGDTRIDALQMPYSVVRQAKGSPAVSEPMALAVLIDFAHRSASTEEDRHHVPVGLWGVERRGEFQFDMVIGMRVDGVVITGYTGSNGELEEIRIAKGNAEQAGLVWQKEPDGKWRATKPTEVVKLFDPVKIGETNAQWVVSRMNRLMNIEETDSERKQVDSRE